MPVAVVGSEEIYPKVGDSRLLARLIGIAVLSDHTHLSGARAHGGRCRSPSKWRIEFCPPIDLSEYGPEAAEDRSLVLELSERVRDTIQEKLYENLVKRGSAFV